MGRPPATFVREAFLASQDDKATIAELVHRLGYEPMDVTALEVTVAAGGRLQVAVTHRENARRRVPA